MTHDELIAGMQSSDPALRAQVQIVLDALSEAADALLAAFRQAHDGRAPETERELRAWWFAQPHGGQYAEWIQDWIAMEAMQASVYEDMTAEVKAEAAEREWEISGEAVHLNTTVRRFPSAEEKAAHLEYELNQHRLPSRQQAVANAADAAQSAAIRRLLESFEGPKQ